MSGNNDNSGESRDHTTEINKDMLKPGDLIYYAYKTDNAKPPDHVVMYIGNGLVIESSKSNKGVIVNNLNTNPEDIVAYATGLDNIKK